MDPVTALGLADDPAKLARDQHRPVPRNASMEALRQLTERGDASKQSARATVSEASSISKRNFLQMAPSEVTDVTSVSFAREPPPDSPELERSVEESLDSAQSLGAQGSTPADSPTRELPGTSRSDDSSPAAVPFGQEEDSGAQASTRGRNSDKSKRSSDHSSYKDAFSHLSSLYPARHTNDASSSVDGAAASESFLPGAASDASVVPLTGSIAHAGSPSEPSTGSPLVGRGVKVSAKAARRFKDALNEDDEDARSESSLQQNLGIDDDLVGGPNSMSTELGKSSINDSLETGAVGIVPNPRGAAPPPGSTSARTANLRHDYLRQQRAQALQIQRERIQMQRER